MDKINGFDRLKSLIIAIFIAQIFVLLPFSSAYAREPQQDTEEYCLSCHEDPAISTTLPDGETLALYISPEKHQQSIHSPIGIECRACHTEISTYPHPTIEYKSKRELSRAYYLVCQKCHSENYDETMDSMHEQVAEEGNLDAPVCTDCHGAHYVRSPDSPRALISNTCGNCHTDIFNNYKDSIHGSALIQEENPDVPVCTDCHGVHNIHDPRTARFRIESPELCAHCHADPDLMDKYGLSADVYNIYNLSWHGVDVTVYKANWPTIWHESAVCTDCHGIHDIRKTHDPVSKVNPNNLLKTCKECHPNAGANWTGSWTGHNQVSLERTPFVFYTQVFYSSLTPFVLTMSVLYVLLQIFRSLVGYVRRSIR